MWSVTQYVWFNDFHVLFFFTTIKKLWQTQWLPLTTKFADSGKINFTFPGKATFLSFRELCRFQKNAPFIRTPGSRKFFDLSASFNTDVNCVGISCHKVDLSPVFRIFTPVEELFVSYYLLPSSFTFSRHLNRWMSIVRL